METIIVLVVLAIAIAATGWSFYRTIKGKKGCGSCSGSCNMRSNTRLSVRDEK